MIVPGNAAAVNAAAGNAAAGNAAAGNAAAVNAAAGNAAAVNAELEAMVTTDEQFNPGDDAFMWNARLRSCINDRFGKVGLTPQQANVFEAWGVDVGNLPEDASRLAIFGCAPVEALNIVGI